MAPRAVGEVLTDAGAFGQALRSRRLRRQSRREGEDDDRSAASHFSHRREEAVLKGIVSLAERYGVPVETAIRTRGAPDQAIYKEAAGGISMVVMGVTRRSGEELYFGETATAVIGKCSGPIVLVANERVRRLYVHLSGDEVHLEPFWQRYKLAARLRNDLVHGGARATPEQAKETIDVTIELVTHLMTALRLSQATKNTGVAKELNLKSTD